MALLTIKGLRKTYDSPTGEETTVLDVPSFEMDEKQHVGLSGPSGSGKTTLLHVISGVLRADEGQVKVAGHDIHSLSESERDRFRAMNVGYVFQTFNLLQGYTALENVVLGMLFGPGLDRQYACQLLEQLGLGDRLHYRPRQLSVGQQQRVALARALANRPRLVLADEPTGNLDAARAREVLELLRRCCDEQGASLLLVSHDPAMLSGLDATFELAQINRANQETTA